MSSRRSILRAFLAALLLHLLLVALTWNADVTGVDRLAEEAERHPEVAVVLVDEPALPDPTLPQAYTSVPERQEIPEPPANPDFLALRNSRAADRIEGGTADASPRAEQTGELSQVAIAPDTGGAPGGAVMREAPEEGGGQEGEADGKTGGESPRDGVDPPIREGDASLARGSAETTAEGERAEETVTSADLADLMARSTPSILEPRKGTPGDAGFEYTQHEVSLDAGNLIQFGDFGLSTAEWEFAPWLEQFKRDFLPNWRPPYAYTHLGVIDGYTQLVMVVQPDGTLSELEISEEEGHESLHRASLAAMRATAPLAPLPRDFPDPELVLSIRLIYSAR